MQRLIDTVLEETAVLDNPYLSALRNGSLSREDFVETQIQFYSAVVFFSRPMAVVAAKIPSARQRVEVLRNVWEEHGEGNGDESHGHTFLTLLSRLGCPAEEVQRRPLWPEVRMFNTTLIGACVMDEYVVGTAMLGIIERMFADISSAIGRAIVERGWLTEDQMIHYSLHAVLDHKHAADFFSVLDDRWPADRYYIEQGLRLGAHAFDTLYRGLYAARDRRWTRDHALPHVGT